MLHEPRHIACRIDPRRQPVIASGDECLAVACARCGEHRPAMHPHLRRARPTDEPHTPVAQRKYRRVSEEHGLDNESSEREWLDGGQGRSNGELQAACWKVAASGPSPDATR